MQTKNRFIHQYFSTTILAVDERKNEKCKQLQEEWNESITTKAKEQRRKAKLLSDGWERDVRLIRAKIQKVVLISGTTQIPEVIKDNNIFKIAEKRLLDIYKLDGQPYLQFILEQQPD